MIATAVRPTVHLLERGVDDRRAEMAETILGFYEELRQRVIQLRAELDDSEAAADGLRQALAALGVEVEGGHAEISGDRLRTEIHNVLRDTDPRHEGVHYQEIAERVEARGHVIRGRNKAGNALAHMSHSPLFRSFGRGVWTWVEAGSEVGEPTESDETAKDDLAAERPTDSP
jgi:hypothetical protein